MESDEFDFTEDEINEQLQQLGYYDVPKDRLREFKKDLEDLMKHDKSRNSSWSTVESGNSRGDTSAISDTENMARNPRHLYPSYHTGDKVYPSKQIEIQLPNSSLISSDLDTQQETMSNTSASSDRRVMKRKVLRKVDGRSQVFDESTVTESDYGDVSKVEERLRALPLNERELERPTTAPSGQRRSLGWNQYNSHSRPQSSRSSCQGSETPVYRLPEDYIGPKALIRPMTVLPNDQIKKSDPVAKYQYYKQSWKTQKAPGEKSHKGLRWNVREQMLYHDEVVEKKPHKVFVPNKYKVPAEKKRKNLRWHIKMDLAQGAVPPSIFD